MMNDILDKARRAQERGDILRVLQADFTNEMTSVKSLTWTLDAMSISLDRDDLEQHLVYLAEQGYVQIWRGRNLPQFRTDRDTGVNPSALLFARLTAKGTQLVDGVTAADPMVNF